MQSYDKPNLKFDGFTLNALSKIGNDNGVKLVYNKNLETITKTINSQDVITRLKGRGSEGLTIEGLDVSEFTVEDLTYFTWELIDDKKIITKDYVESQFLNSYPLPKEGIKSWTDIKEQLELFNKMRIIIHEIEVPETTYEVQFAEFRKQGIPFNDISLGDTVTIIDDGLGIVEKVRVVELDTNPQKMDLSTATLASRRSSLVDYLTALNDTKKTIEDLTDHVNNKYAVLQDAIDKATHVLNGENSKIIFDNEAIYCLQKDTLGESGEILNTTKLLKIANGAVGISTNGGNTYTTAMTPDGINTDVLVGQIIMGQYGDFENILVKNQDNDVVVKMGKFTSTIDGVERYGMQITSGALEIIDGISKEQVDENFFSEVNLAITSLETNINAIFSDAKLTKDEAKSLKLVFENFKNESGDLFNKANDHNITTEKTNYNDALNDLETLLYDSYIDKLTYPIDITEDERTTLESRFEDVQTTKIVLENLIKTKQDEVIKNEINQEITELDNSFKSFQDNLQDIIFDSKLTQVEANILKSQMETLKKESADLVLIATDLDLFYEKQTYQNSLDDLENYLNTYWLDKTYPLDITTSQRNTIDIKIGNVQESKSELINAIIVGRNKATKAQIDFEIDQLNNTMTDFQTDLETMSFDGKLTDIEANILDNNFKQLKYESYDVINIASDLGITTIKANYQSKLNELEIYLDANWLNKVYPLQISEQQRDVINDKFNQVQYAKSQLLNAITSAYVDENAVTVDKLYNGVQITPEDGLIVQRSDNEVRTLLNATTGIAIQKRKYGSWINQLYADTSGNLIARDLTAENITINNGQLKDGSGNTLIDLERRKIDFSKFTTVTGKISASSIETENLVIKSGNIDGLIGSNQLNVKGLKVTDSNGNTTLKIDSNGNITLGGNITWNSKPTVTPREIGAKEEDWYPRYNEILGGKPDIDADNTFDELRYSSNIKGFTYKNGALYLDADYIQAGSISGDYISGGQIVGTKIMTAATGKRIRLEREFIDFIDNGSAKMQLGYVDTNGNDVSEPYLIMGVGDGTGKNIGVIHKDENSMDVYFIDKNGVKQRIELHNDGYIKFHGDVDFSNASVTGLGSSSGTAVLG